MSINPKLKAVVIESGTIPGEFSLRVIKGGKQVPIQLSIKDAGFVPGDILQVGLLSEWENLEADANDADVEELQAQIHELEDRIQRASRELDW